MARAPVSEVASPVDALTSSPSTKTRTYRRNAPVSSRILNRRRGYRSSSTSRRWFTESAATFSFPRGPNSRSQLSRCTSSGGAGEVRAERELVIGRVGCARYSIDPYLWVGPFSDPLSAGSTAPRRPTPRGDRWAGRRVNVPTLRRGHPHSERPSPPIGQPPKTRVPPGRAGRAP